MPHGSQVLIGLDIGTTSVKAVMLTQEGRSLASYSAAHPTRRSMPGMAEQDPATWLMHVGAALAQFARHPRARDVSGIGITSQVNTHVFCDASMAALAPALTWQDTRPGQVARDIDGRLTLAERIQALGAPIPVDASHALARMAWMAQTAPEIWAATRHVLLPKDWVIAQLTGAVASDPLSAIGLAGTDLRYAQTMLSLMPRAAEVLPPLLDPLCITGALRDGPFRGVPIATGTMDAWAAMIGLGVANEGQAMYLSGTSEVLGLISAKRTAEPGIIVFPEWRGITLHAGPTQSGGAARDWIARMLGLDHAQLDTLAAQTRIRGDSPLFLPTSRRRARTALDRDLTRRFRRAVGGRWTRRTCCGGVGRRGLFRTSCAGSGRTLGCACRARVAPWRGRVAVGCMVPDQGQCLGAADCARGCGRCRCSGRTCHGRRGIGQLS